MRIGTKPRVLLALGVLAGGFLTLASAPPSVATEVGQANYRVDEKLGTVTADNPVFWQTPLVLSSGEGGRAKDPIVCDTVLVRDTCILAELSGPPDRDIEEQTGQFDVTALCGVRFDCFRYEVEVGPGEELRIAAQTNSLRDWFDTYVFAPGSPQAAATLTGRHIEERLPAVPGTWTLVVKAYDVQDEYLRLRLALDPRDEAPVPRRLPREYPEEMADYLLPDLEVMPPFEMAFGPCHPEGEMTEGATRCLRFATGPANVGRGPLVMDVPDDLSLGGAMTQTLRHKDPGHPDLVVEAGLYEYHREHGHYHHDALQDLKLHRVEERGRKMVHVADSPKQGFCLGATRIAVWHSFAQDAGDDVSSNCLAEATPPVATRMALPSGWVDVYEWWREGNFVDFAGQPDGVYVLTVATNWQRHIYEADLDDNLGYTMFRVTGDCIEVLERGRGSGPFDPHRELVDDHARPTRWLVEQPVCPAR